MALLSAAGDVNGDGRSGQAYRLRADGDTQPVSG